MRSVLFFVYVSFKSFYGLVQRALGLDSMSAVFIYGTDYAAGDYAPPGDWTAEKYRFAGPLALGGVEFCGLCRLLYPPVLQQHVLTSLADRCHLAGDTDCGHFDESFVLSCGGNAARAEESSA